MNEAPPTITPADHQELFDQIVRPRVKDMFVQKTKGGVVLAAAKIKIVKLVHDFNALPTQEKC